MGETRNFEAWCSDRLNFMKANAISLFSNCGAGDVGFAAAGFRFGIMAELVERRLEVALRNHPGAVGVAGDLTTTWTDVVAQWRSTHGPAVAPSLLAACPPCQGMSTACAHRGPQDDPDAGSRDPRNLLVLPVAEIAKALEPALIVVENVTAFLTRKVRDPRSGAAMSAALLLVRLLSDEYAVYPFLSDLADFGVPQTRKRTFLTFARRDTGAAERLRDNRCPYPVPDHAADYDGQHIPLGAALESFRLPPLDACSPRNASDPETTLHFVPVWTTRQHRMVATIPPGSGDSAWTNSACPSCGVVDCDPDCATCPVCGVALLRPIVFEANGPRLVRGFRRGSYRRMHPGRPAATITTASGRVGGSRTIHPYQNRVLSPLECALLQTIPRDFVWGETDIPAVTAIRSMIGEAVPPLFTRKHGDVLMALLSGDDDVPLIERTDRRCANASERLFAEC